MGLHGSVINHLSNHKLFGEAFLERLPEDHVDVLVQDISNLLRIHTAHLRDWEEFSNKVVDVADNLLVKVHSLIYCADNPRFVPRAKEVERLQRTSRPRNGLPLEPLGDSELMQECITSRKAGLPDMERALITPRLKEFFPAIYADFILGGVVLDPRSEIVKTIVVDGVTDEMDPLKRMDYRAKTFEKRAATGVKETEHREIGESDLRWVRWLERFVKDGEESWGRWDAEGPLVVVLDMNDGDVLPIALLNLCSFLPKNEDIPFRLYIHHGKMSKWGDYLPTSDRKALVRRQKRRLIDVSRLWEIIIGTLKGEFRLYHAVEIFCALMLLPGSDYVKAVNTRKDKIYNAPFKGLGFASALKIFMDNPQARMEFALQVKVPTCFVQIGNPRIDKALQFHNERMMLGLVKRYYQGQFYKDDNSISPPHGEIVESFEALRKADNKKRARKARDVEMSSTQEVKKRKRTPSQPEMSDILTENEALSVIRRIFWNLDYWLRGWTGRYDPRTCLDCDPQTRVSRWGYEWNPDEGRVELASRVFI